MPPKKVCSAVPPETGRVRQDLYEGRKPILRTAKSLAAQGAHSPRLWHAMSHTVQDMLDGYRDRGERSGHAQGARQAAATGAEHARVLGAFGASPTNNASKRARRYIAAFQKTVGQTVGGLPAVRRLGGFAACTPPPWGETRQKCVRRGRLTEYKDRVNSYDHLVNNLLVCGSNYELILKNMVTITGQ